MKINTEKFIVRIIDNETILLCFQNGESHRIDDMGTLFLHALEEHNGDTHQAILHIAKLFPNQKMETIVSDFTNFTTILTEKEILIP